MKKYKMKINGESYEAKILSYKGNEAKVNVNGIDYLIEIEKDSTTSQPIIQTGKSYMNPEKLSSTKMGESGNLLAPIPGVVVNVHKKEGDRVEAGDVMLSLEAMKMESELVAPVTGTIKRVKVTKGDSVLEGDLLVEITPDKKQETVKATPIKQSPPTQVRTEPKVSQKQKGSGGVRAPIPGTVLDVKVKEGDSVTADDVVIILEAMKMESEIRAGVDGKVIKINTGKGNSVNEGDLLIEIGES